MDSGSEVKLLVNDFDSLKVSDTNFANEKIARLLTENAELKSKLEASELRIEESRRKTVELQEKLDTIDYQIPENYNCDSSLAERVGQAANQVSLELAKAPQDRVDLAINGSHALGLIRMGNSGNVAGLREALDNNSSILLMRTISTPGTFGFTLLHHASDLGRLEICEFLLNRGMDPWCTDLVGRTPLHVAAQKLHTDVVLFLKERMGDVTGENAPRDFGGSTPAAHCALTKPRTETAKKCRNDGLSILHRNGDHSISPSPCRTRVHFSRNNTGNAFTSARKSLLRSEITLTQENRTDNDASNNSKNLEATLRLEYGHASIPGFRVTMEDAICINTNICGCLALFAVFDGHGGSGAAEFCSKRLSALLEDTPDIKSGAAAKESNILLNALREACFALDSELAQQPEFKFHEKIVQASMGGFAAKKKYCAQDESGTTMTFAVVASEFIVIANLGDSRTVVFDSENMLLATQDHSMKGSEKEFWEGEVSRIKSAGGLVTDDGRIAMNSSNPSINNLGMSRCLGDFEFKQPSKTPGGPVIISCEPEIYVIDRNTKDNGGDQFILLACDGLWDVLSTNDCIQSFKNANRESIPSSDSIEGHTQMLDTVCDDIVLKCLGSYDNISLVAVRLMPAKTTFNISCENEQPVERNLLYELLDQD